VTTDRHRAFDTMRAAVGFYGGFFPRYNRVIAESGFPAAAEAIKNPRQQGGREAASRGVPDAPISAIGIAGSPTESRERVGVYLRSGMKLPIISPRLSGPDPKQQVIDALRACAP